MSQLQFDNFPTVTTIRIIEPLWPMETECGMCEEDLVAPQFSVPMCDGEVNESSDVYFNVCNICYQIYEENLRGS